MPDPSGFAPRLILGSASPRRLDLLALIGVRPDEVRPADIDETPHPAELPRRYADRIAGAKNAALAAGLAEAESDALLLTADTVVAAGRRILGKPDDAAEAERFLRLLSGRRHMVITAVVLRRGARLWNRRSETRVTFKRLSEPEIAAYLAFGEWRGKAGGYAIQGRAAGFAPSLNGSWTGVVGLPLTETAGLLEGAGYPLNRACAA